ncbi:MAG: RDD family protein [Erysipelotrichaceae bacterium]|jgi:uncharacterized RDD family membrane protein YckC|nr:RDD family protein [Erysipelotrichaceae bacterium]
MENLNTRTRYIEEVNTSKKIVPAGLFARTVAAIVDLAIVAFVAGMFIMAGLAIAERTPVVVENINLMRDYSVDSGLMHYVVVDGKETTDIATESESINYKDYEDILINYFTVYKVSGCPEEYRDTKYTQYWYNVHILGLAENPDAPSYNDLATLPNMVKERGNKIFMYDLSADNPYESRPVLIEDTDTMKSAALSYYFIPEDKNSNNDYYMYSYAITDLMSTPYYNHAYTMMYVTYYIVPIVISIILSSIIFYFIIPICTKNGQTLGKITFHLGLVNKIGYQYKKSQLIPRFFFDLIVLVAMYLITDLFPYGLSTFVLVATCYLLASYMCVIFTKDHKAIHDMFAMTIVIDMRQSTWFKDASQEQNIQKRIDKFSSIDFSKSEDNTEN